MDANTTSTNSQTSSKKRKHKLEIQVYEADWEDADRNNGQPRWRPIRSDPALDGGRPNIIEVADKKEFAEIQKQYAMCDQKIKVIREIDPFVDEDISKNTQNIPQNNQAIPVSSVQPTTNKDPVVRQNVDATSSQSTSVPQIQQVAGASNAQYQPVVLPSISTKNDGPQMVAAPLQLKAKPKIVTIGDIEVKYDGDKVYQKQWMKLTPIEASNFRIVNDANNKVISMSGKRIEAKRWVLVEEKTDAQNDDVVDNLIGE